MVLSHPKIGVDRRQCRLFRNYRRRILFGQRPPGTATALPPILFLKTTPAYISELLMPESIPYGDYELYVRFKKGQ